ncbi:trichohyalin-like [Oncorhynchus clarkii lewisi]|uniref:trichohyalin-like n=1 Tax=Oncorhynchus clarkii lewisi TaxID=490388 RepID=UPI0039B8A243
MRRRTQACTKVTDSRVSAQLRHLGRMYPMDPERRSHQREYEEPERRSHQREYEEPERHSHQREYEEPERHSHQREYGEPERRSHQREYGEPERRSHQREYGEPERCSQWKEYGEPEGRSHQREYGEPEGRSHQREYGEPERRNHQREYGEPERRSHQREYGEPERRSHQREYGEPERRSHQREYGEPERRSHQREYEEPERHSHQREYGEPERRSHQREYGEPERRSHQREYGEPERRSHQREYGEPERRSHQREYGEPERRSHQREYGEPERRSHQREYGEPERRSHQREYGEPERRIRRKEYGEPSSGQWNDSLKRDSGQAMARELYSEYSSMRRTREGWGDYGASSDMSYIMDPSSRDWSEGSLRGSGAPFSPDTDGDVDGDPVELSVEDLELIEEKRAVLALQKVKRGAKDMPKTQTAYTTAKGMSKQRKANNRTFNSNVADQSSRIPLKRRVLDILSKDTPPELKKQNKMRALELMIRAPLENEEARPLRLRVLMNQRRYPDNEEVVPNDKRQIQRPVHSLRTQEKDIAATGFQRFLNVLNEGVDLNKLSKIVNNKNGLLIVGEELPQVWPTLPEGHVDSSSRSKSSLVEEKTKVRLEDEQRHEQMQTLLEIVGLDLGVEELGQLTDRTNDRLYGKMGDLKRKEFENEKGKREKGKRAFI